MKTQPIGIMEETPNDPITQPKRFQLKKALPEEEPTATLILPTLQNEVEEIPSPDIRSPLRKKPENGTLISKGFGYKDEPDRKSDQGDKKGSDAMDLETDAQVAGFTKKFKPKGGKDAVVLDKSTPTSNENSNTEPFGQAKKTTEKPLTSKQRIIEDEKKRKEEEKKQKDEEGEQRKKAEQDRRNKEEEKKRKEEEAKKKKAEKEAEKKKKAQEEEAERKIREEAEAKKRKEEEARRKKEEEEARKKRELEEAKRKKEEEAQLKKEEAAAKKKKEEEAKKKKEAEERKKQESAKKKREEEIERRKKEEEAEELTRKFLEQEEEMKKKNDEEDLRLVLMMIEEEERNKKKFKGKAGGKTNAKVKDEEDDDTEVEEEVKTVAAGKKKVSNTRKGKEPEEAKRGRPKKDMDIEEERPRKASQNKSAPPNKVSSREDTPSKKKVVFVIDEADSDHEDKNKAKRGASTKKDKKAAEEEKITTSIRKSKGSKTQVEEPPKASILKGVLKKSPQKGSKKTNLLSVDADEYSPQLSPRGSRSSSKKAGRHNFELEEEEKKNTRDKKVKGNSGEVKEPPRQTARHSQQPVSSKDTKEKPKTQHLKASSQKMAPRTYFTAEDEEVLLKRNSYQVLFSGFDKSTEIDEIKKKFGLLVGARVVDDVDKNFNVLVMDQFKRTVKFLYALNRGTEIVEFRWVIESLNNGKILPTLDYAYSDPESERKWNYRVQRSIDLARKNDPGFLKERKIWMAKTVIPSYEDMKLLVESAGGSIVASKPKEFRDDLIVIMNEDDKRNYDDLKSLGFDIYKPELILSGSLQQKLNFKEHIIRHRS